MLRPALVTFTTLFLACAGAEPSTSSAVAQGAAQYGAEMAQDEAAAPPEAAPEVPTCQVTFSPDAALLEETTAAAARWSAATGCDVRVGEGGIAVTLVAEGWSSPRGLPADGRTIPTDETNTHVAIEVAAKHRTLTVIHEMGHAIRFDGDHVEDNAAALMFHDGGKGRITADDITYACSRYLVCPAFAPEE